MKFRIGKYFYTILMFRHEVIRPKLELGTLVTFDKGKKKNTGVIARISENDKYPDRYILRGNMGGTHFSAHPTEVFEYHSTDPKDNDFYSQIMSSEDEVFYAQYIKPTDSEHEMGRTYKIKKEYDKTLYSSYDRGFGLDIFVSPIINTHFIRSNKEAYESQNN